MRLPISMTALFTGIVLSMCPAPSFAQSKIVDIQGLEQQIQSMLGKARSCTVGVDNGGSGVVVSKDGLVLTCAHVAKEAGRKIQVTFHDGRRVSATTLGNYADADAGLVRINTPGEYEFAEMGRTRDVKVGDWVLAIGYPVMSSKRQAPPVRIGRVRVSASNSLVSDAPIMGGDSGGPLFDLSGKVIGISSRVSQDIVANVHVPIDQFHKNWDRLLASEDWSSRRSGRPRRPSAAPKSGDKSKAQPASAVTLRSVGITLEQTDKGAKVKSLTVGSLAHNSGVRAGHIVLKINNVAVKTTQECEAELRKHAGKKNVNIVVTRTDPAHGKITLGLRLQEK